MKGIEVEQLLETAASTIGRRIDDDFAMVESVRRRVADAFDRAQEYRRDPDRATLAEIRPLVQGLLLDHDCLIESVGVAVEERTLADAERWLEWWLQDGVGGSHFIRHQLNPAAVGFYDYQAQTWFREPLRREHALAVGPYFDAGGIEAYTITLACPLLRSADASCVAGGDISISRLEALLLSVLGTRRHPIVLVSGNDRVIASNNASYTTGSRFRLAGNERVAGSVPILSSVPEGLPWRLVTIECKRPFEPTGSPPSSTS